MHLVSRALAWVRAMLFGPPESSRTACATAPQTTPSPPVHNPSPEMWAAILASARRRRAPSPWPPSVLPAISAHDITSTLVGTYLHPPEIRQRARAAARFAEEACR